MSFDGRLRDLIVAAMPAPVIEFSSDDITFNGQLTAAGNHDPNGTQNAIGSAFRTWHAQRLIEPTGRSVRSKALHRKGGAIQVWRVTERGRAWATTSDRLL